MGHNLGEALKSVLPAPDVEMLKLIAGVAGTQGVRLFAVGGLPRDLALGRMPSDFDLVVEGSAVALSRALVGEFGGTFTEHSRFGTVQWHLERSRTPWGLAVHNGGTPARRMLIDLVSARSESYARPAALPQVAFGGIEDDLRRRDFTINTLALRLDGPHYGEVLDPLDAMGDLQRRLIRALHEASFRDDPTRMLRAIRYEKRLGFRIDPGTLRLIPTGTIWLRHVSAHRLRQELNAALDEEQAASMVRRMGTLGLLHPIHPDLPVDGGSIRRLRVESDLGNDRQPPAQKADEARIRWLLWFLDLSPVQMRSIWRRLLFDSHMTAQMLAAASLWHRRHGLARLRPSQLSMSLDEMPRISVRAVERALPGGRSKKMLQKYLAKWRTQRPITNGSDLRRRGIAPGPVYREILQHLRAGWIDGSIRNAAQERQTLESWLEGHKPRRKAGQMRHTPSRRTNN